MGTEEEETREQVNTVLQSWISRKGYCSKIEGNGETVDGGRSIQVRGKRELDESW